MVKKDSGKISHHHHTSSPLDFFSYSYWRSGKKKRKNKKKEKKVFEKSRAFPRAVTDRLKSSTVANSYAL